MKPIKPEGLETPGLVWQRRSKRRGKKLVPLPTDPYVGYWVCRDDIVARGYSLRTQRMWPPAGQPYALPTLADWQDISASCTRLQDEMRAFVNLPPGGIAFDARQLFDGSLGSLVEIYLSDPDSPYFKNRFHTRKSYRSKMLSIKKAVGEARIVPRDRHSPKISFRDFNRWVDRWSEPKTPDGPKRPGRAHGYMAFVRILFSFGAVCELPRCDALHGVLSKMEFKPPKKRKQIVSREQAILVIDEAHRRGEHSIAFAQAIMADFLVRQKDALGEWIPLSEPGISDIISRGEKCLCGVRWDENENGVLDHRLSKSLRGKDAVSDPDAGKPMRFTLALYPLVMAEIARIPVDQRHGPMVKAEHSGLPWRQKVFGSHWRKIARAVGIPDNVQNRDTKAGGASEAETKGASRESIRSALGHRKVETTDIYLRNELEGPDKIARLRFGTEQDRE